MADSKQSRVAFVTGAGPGLGASLARRFAKEYAVAINARSESFVRSLADEIRAAGGVALEVPGDIGARDQVAGRRVGFRKPPHGSRHGGDHAG